METGGKQSVRSGWMYLTNHAHVVMCLARDRELRLRDIAEAIGITERAAQQIVADLEGAGVITRCRVGRRNLYEVRRDAPMRHPLEHGITVGDLIDLIACQSPEHATAEGRGAARPTLPV